MTIVEIFLLAVSLCFDTLAVSLVGGACIPNMKMSQRLKILVSFGGVQALFTLIGWLLGSSVLDYISKFDHWIAFILLLYIGGKMIKEAFSKSDESESVDLLNTGKLLISSVATSIDALAVGVSLAMVDITNGRAYFTFAVIGLVTVASSEIGLRGGSRLASFIGTKANLLGGVILIGIGAKILLEHILS